MPLKTLKPRLQTLTASRIKVLDNKAGATQRVAGSAWMAIRRKVLTRDAYTCQQCGIVRSDNEIDHRIPLEQGGGNDMSNLQTLCGGATGCHTAKSKAEAAARGPGKG